jgi:hypothetical protein
MTGSNIYDLDTGLARRDPSPLDHLLDDVLMAMGHARIFLRAGEPMPADDLERYDELMESLAILRSGGPYR